MRFSFNPDLLHSAVVTTLRASVTLQGASYLNGANKIFSGRAPTDIAAPLLIVTSVGFSQDSGSVWSGEIRVTCKVPLLSNGQVDPKVNTILAKCEELLADETVSVTGMTVQPFVPRGIVPAYFDQEDNKTMARGLLRLGTSIGYN